MKLRFFAKPGHLCRLPGPSVAGDMPRYVGRKVRVVGTEIRNEILETPTEIESTSREGQRILRRFIVDAQDPPLIPADAETARACGVPFHGSPPVQPKVSPKGAKHEVNS
jgi:hypothetical protein